MAIDYPTNLDNFPNPQSTDLLDNSSPTLDHWTQHANINDAVEALEAKVGVDGSAVTTSFDYKLNEITGSDKAVGKTATQTLTNKTLTSPKVNVGSDATADMYYRGADGTLTRIPIGTNTQILMSDGSTPSFQNNPAGSDASTTVKGVVEIATTSEINAGTGTGGTGAKIAITPDNLVTSIYAGFNKNFGTGADGDLTYDGSTTILGVVPSGSIYTLNRDIYANNMTVNAGVTINTGGYRIFVKGTLTHNGTIQNNGGNGGTGGNGSGGTAGSAGSAGSAASANTVIAGNAGKAGGAGSANGGSIAAGNGTAGDSTTNSVGVSGVAGAVGGTATGNGTVNGGTVGAAGTATASKTSFKTLGDVFSFYNLSGLVTGSAGSGSGSGGGASSASSNASGGGGGGSGGAGGVVYVLAYQLAGTGTLKSVGGNGGNGGNGAVTSGDAGGGGGGGGGGGAGGIIILASATTANPYTMTVTGGTGGTGGTGAQSGSGTGANGSNGSNGTTGVYFFI